MPDEFKRNGVQVVHLATGFVVGYPPCPYLRQFKELLEKKHGLEVVVGTHPIPLKYLSAHEKLSFWKDSEMQSLAGDLIAEDRTVMKSYD